MRQLPLSIHNSIVVATVARRWICHAPASVASRADATAIPLTGPSHRRPRLEMPSNHAGQSVGGFWADSPCFGGGAYGHLSRAGALLASVTVMCLLAGGCSAFPDAMHQAQLHNPFPQLSRVAVLPFYNQSADPTIDQDKIALHYYNELQRVPGFEVMPVGAAKVLAHANGSQPQTGEDFQQLARQLGVDAVVVGSVTEYSPYYPPRIGLAVRWYAANPGFHPIPPGYGLPWGTAEEEFIPESVVFEAEYTLAREQLKTQSPLISSEQPANQLRAAQHEELPTPEPEASREPALLPTAEGLVQTPDQLPPEWPDPRGFIPPSPKPVRPKLIPQSEPVLSLTRIYHGNDADFTSRLEEYYYFRDEARFGGWQAYLERSEDFIRFCCYLHIDELLSARGGAGKSRVVLRWPIDRYER